ncbi:hypothetical protein EJ08DRAFT_731760 [Tothia fuscella]|uniref:Meiotically up-regulated gene 190 protein n=1 Tax=Tothia fuscella TaxID=1048955 RepID=A0A9P4U1Y0_9PEZI|nr:hypothetical protein EJ08DRAFT_731760 [Tothia fuscella]
MSGVDDANQQRRKFKSPYTPSNPIPTIQHYRKEKKEREDQAGTGASTGEEDERSRKEKAQDAYTSWKEGDKPHAQEGNDVYPTENKNVKRQPHSGDEGQTDEDEDEEEEAKKEFEDTSEAVDASLDPKAKRKNMKHRKGDGAERDVTDPVTHLPVTVHDFTGKNLDDAPDNLAPARTTTGLSGPGEKSSEELKKDAYESSKSHKGMERLFPPPNYGAVGAEIASIHSKSLTIGLGLVMANMIGLVLLEKRFGLGSRIESSDFRRDSAGRTVSSAIIILLGAALGGLTIWGAREWASKKVKDVWERHVWEAERQEGKALSKDEVAESTQWLNELLASVWPLINPDLFISLADTLEDVMQASLPKLVRMISVEDIGQGSEALRILGIRWLPTGAATKSVDSDGKLKKNKKNDPQNSDRSVPGQGEIQDASKENKKDDPSTSDKNDEKREQEEESDENIAEGMEAEEGDFVNMEVAFSYRARPQGKGMRTRAKNAHLYLAFYLPGGIKFPVWVEMRGLVGVMRLRLQLTPDPPFFSLCTLTFLGQPKVDMSCVPLTKKGLNIMDLPLISNFVQSAVDAAMAEYVAPKSLTLDLKDMLIGDDFKKDTAARGILVVRIKKAFDFKEGDAGILMLKDGSADAYVTVGWAKFGKPVWSTRVIESDMNPYWEETAYMLVTAAELNVRERLRVQLWDSDRTTADDDLGRIEVDLKDLMQDDRSNGKMWDRQDGFRALKAGEGMPGKLDWSVGYYSKTRIHDDQLAQQTSDPDVKNIDNLKRKVNVESERKLREAKHDESGEIEQQKAQDFKEREDQLIISTPPPAHYPSGVLSIVVHQITGLELEAINKGQVAKNENAADEQEEGEDLPSAYCIIILNHNKVFRTRTKPKNGKPFFNAGCEKFIRDWRTAEVIIAVRDARIHEDDALLGVVTLPLKELFKDRSQTNDIYPLAGGVGYGKCRVSMVFRSVQLQVPKELLGWEYGTLDIKSSIRGTIHDNKIDGLRIKARTSLGRGKFYSDGQGSWKTKKDTNIRLPVQKRYSSTLILEFRSNSALLDKTPAFAILWLKDIPDEEERTVQLTVWRGDLKKAEANAIEDCGEKVGEVELTLTLYRGLSGYHNNLASKDTNIADIMEILDCANDVNDTEDTDLGSSPDTDSSISSDEEKKDKKAVDRRRSSMEENGKRGTIDQFKDYKVHSKQLHRKNRGLMQWKAPRTLQWMKNKVAHGEQRVEDLFKHGQKEPGIQTEA